MGILPGLKLIVISGESRSGARALMRSLYGNFSLDIMQSITTDPKYKKVPSREYTHMPREEFLTQRMYSGQFLWTAEDEDMGLWYGTLTEPIHNALCYSSKCSVLRAHSLGSGILRNYAQCHAKLHHILSVFVTCENEEEIRRIIREKTPDITLAKLNMRVQLFLKKQETAKLSGWHNTILTNNGDKTPNRLLTELLPHIT